MDDENMSTQKGSEEDHSTKSKKKKPRKDHFKRPHPLDEEHDKIYEEQRKVVSAIKILLEETEYEKKLSVLSEVMDFVRAFTSKGVQGVVGFTLLKRDKKNPLVFKLSVDINRSVEHEFLIMENLNDMRRYCPHFSRSLGMVNIPVSNDFINDSYNHNLLTFDEETIPRNILFMEYINKLPFYRLCDDCDDKNVIISQVLQVILSLQIAQNKKRLTHYDLHTANILMQMCEPNSVFVYKIGEETLFVPTFGFFPMIIDTGISYADAVNGQRMMTNTDSYDHGFQSTEFDPLNDIHHFLIATFYYIEVESDAYDHLSNKIKFIFRHLPVLRKSGWKMLPNDLCDIVIERIKDDCRSYKRYELFDEYDKQSLEIFNNLLDLPLKRQTEDKDFSTCFPAFMEEFHKMIHIDDFSEHDAMFVLREIISGINDWRELYKKSPREGIEMFRKKLKESISVVLKENVRYDIEYEKMFVSAIVFSEKLETIYTELIEENRDYISQKYKSTVVKKPIDMFYYISKNLTPHFEIDNDTVVYLWDTNGETKEKLSCKKLSKTDIKRVNNELFSNKGELLLKIL